MPTFLPTGTWLALMLFAGTNDLEFPGAPGPAVYVRAGAAGLETGLTWEDAFTDLQDALSRATKLAEQGQSVEVWVAGGVYKPDSSTGDRSAGFQLQSRVALFGGFAGHETTRGQRRPGQFATILSGDLTGDDDLLGSPTGGSSDCCHAHAGPGCDDQTCMSMICGSNLPPACCANGDWTEACARLAAAQCCTTCSTRHDCDNAAHVVRADGTDESAILDGFTITAGRADLAGPFNDDRGGGVLVRNGGATLRNCRFVGNTAANGGMAVALQSAIATIEKCEFRENVNLNSFGGALLVIDSRARVDDCVFHHNRAPGGAGALTTLRSDPVFAGCRFVENEGVVGGAYFNDRFPTLIGCLFVGNRSTCLGGAVSSFADAINRGCQIAGAGETEGAPWNEGSPETSILQNCTVTNNVNVSVLSARNDIVLDGCIVWGNQNQVGEVHENAQVDTSEATHPYYSIIQGWTGNLGGVGNSGEYPLFVDADGPDDVPGNEDDDVRLLPGSPAIDAGDPDPRFSTCCDLDGLPRELCGRVDIGAYEFGIGDFNCDHDVDLGDYASFPACMTGPDSEQHPPMCEVLDFNADRAVDLADFAAFARILR